MTKELGSKPESKKKIWIIVGLVVLVVAFAAGIFYWYSQVKIPHDEAVSGYEDALVQYDEAVAGLAVKNEALTSKISELEALTTSDDAPLDPDLLQTSGGIIGEAQAAVVPVPASPAVVDEVKGESTEEINSRTAELEADTADLEAVEPHDAEIAKVDEAITTLGNSIAQLKQVTNPSEQFVIQRLTGLPTVTGVQAATEDNDPNGLLHKQGGYTSAVFFTSDLVDRSKLWTEGDIVNVGTDGGGAVEVYETVEGAEARDSYISQFDGTILRPGSHYVVGTCVVRVSGILMASQQQEIQSNIVEALTMLDN